MHRAPRGLTACALAGLLATCTSPSIRPPATALHEGQANFHLLADDRMAHYQWAPGFSSSGAALLDHPAPSYPPAMLTTCPAEVALRALLIVGDDGAVDEVRVDDASDIAPAFLAAVRTAAMAWRFEPLIISHPVAGAKTSSHPFETEATPFSLPYAFRFACHAGKAEVSSAAARL